MSMDREKIAAILNEYDEIIVSESDREKVRLTIDWKNQFPKDAGVYAFFMDDKIVYVGETGSLQGRMNDMRNSQHHTLRRSVGTRKFGDIPGFEQATSHKKFPPHIEELVIEYLCGLQVKALPVHFGRKEIEEYLITKYSPIYNQKTKRGTVPQKSTS